MANFVLSLSQPQTTTVESVLFSGQDSNGDVLLSVMGSEGTYPWIFTTTDPGVTPPTRQQVIDGHDHTGGAAAASGNITIGSLGVESFTALPDTLVRDDYYFVLAEDFGIVFGETPQEIKTTAPTITGVVTNLAGDQITLTFSDPMLAPTTDATDFTMPGHTLSNFTGFGKTWTLGVSPAVANGDVDDLDYSAVTGDLTDDRGNMLASFVDQSIANSVPPANVVEPVGTTQGVITPTPSSDIGVTSFALPPTQQGDYVLFFISADNGPVSAATTTANGTSKGIVQNQGWTLLRSAFTVMEGRIVGKRMGATPDTTIDIESDGSESLLCGALAIRNVDTTQEIDNGVTTRTFLSLGPGGTSPHETVTDFALRVIVLFMDDDKNKNIGPSDYTEQISVSEQDGFTIIQNSMSVMTKLEPFAGTDSGEVWEGNNDNYVSFSFALRTQQ